MSDYYNDTLDYLVAKGILTEFSDLKIYIMEEPDNDGVETSLTLIPTGGLQNDAGEGKVEYPGIQFLLRAESSTTCFEIFRWIKKILTNASDLAVTFEEYKTWDTLPDTWDEWEAWSNNLTNVFGWENTSSMISLGKDEKQRFRMSDNYIIYVNEED